MRIDLNAKAAEVRDSSKSAGSSRSHAAAAKPEVADEARLSADATKVEALEKQIQQLPDIRQERVGRLQAQVQNGRYEVTSAKIAEAMFGAMLVPSLR
jgi:flagellar biosynthesis anti-sigma factor FlgM